ncbi:hypothetical protein [Croceiramulus getboli]|nr:DUF4440 domain-containing protein [Flavobacteriaceae bacterium YJPT1-3]
MNIRSHTCAIYILLVSFPALLVGQVSKEDELFRTIMQRDSLLFEVGFNQCDMKSNASLLADDLEFYHDVGGVTYGKDTFLKNFEKNMCDPDKKPIRKLIAGSTVLYPLYDNQELYGVIQNGDHAFYIQEPGKELYQTGVAKFTHLWIRNQEQWKIKRVLSFDHMSASDIKTINLSTEQLSRFVGRYQAPKTGDVTLQLVDGHLQIKAGKVSALLIPIGEQHFQHPQAPLTFEFQGVKGAQTMIVREDGKEVERAIQFNP